MLSTVCLCEKRQESNHQLYMMLAMALISIELTWWFDVFDHLGYTSSSWWAYFPVRLNYSNGILHWRVHHVSRQRRVAFSIFLQPIGPRPSTTEWNEGASWIPNALRRSDSLVSFVVPIRVSIYLYPSTRRRWLRRVDLRSSHAINYTGPTKKTGLGPCWKRHSFWKNGHF